MDNSVNNDPVVFLSLLRPIERELEVYCRRLIWDQQDAPDAIQNTLLRAVGAFDRYHADASFRAWMFRILTNEVFALNRKHARLAKHEFQVGPEEMAALAGPDDTVAWGDLQELPVQLVEFLDDDLVTALKTLTENERAALLLRAIGEFRYREIGQMLSVPIGTVMGNLARARQKMRAAILRLQPKPQTNQKS